MLETKVYLSPYKKTSHACLPGNYDPVNGELKRGWEPKGIGGGCPLGDYKKAEGSLPLEFLVNRRRKIGEGEDRTHA